MDPTLAAPAPLAELPVYRRLPSSAAGAWADELCFADGSEVLDLYGGHCVNTLGAGDEGLLEVLTAQWRTLSFTTNLVATAARERFLAAFGRNLPRGSWSVFLSNSGAEANENALKAALLATGRRVVVAFGGAFHGRTAGAAAVTDKRYPFPTPPFEVRRVPFGDAAAAEAAIDGEVACVIVEPIQSLAGVVTPERAFLAALRAAASRAGARLVFDEVQTGNGRLGPPFAAQAFGVVPDALTTAKGAAGGLPIGVTVLAREAFPALPAEAFGSTFGGGPCVLAVAAEVARRVGDPRLAASVEERSTELCAVLAAAPAVAAVRGRGLLLGLELVPGLAGPAVRDALLARGVLVGTTDDPRVLRLTPPLTLSSSAPRRLAAALATLEVPRR